MTSGLTNESDIYRIKAELLLKQHSANGAEAERRRRSAIKKAPEQDAKSAELRATLNLAWLLASRGRRDEARVSIVEIYNWLTEGFDTDLKDAKALLDELSNLL